MQGNLVFVSEHAHFLHVSLGYEKQGIDFQGRIRAKVHAHEGTFVFVCLKFVEFLVFLVRDFLFGPHPNGVHSVDFLAIETNWELNEGGVLFDNVLDPVFLSEFGKILLQLDDDFCFTLRCPSASSML